MRAMQSGLLWSLFVLLSPPALAEDHTPDGHQASLGSVTVTHAWARAVTQGEDAFVFFELENSDEPMLLTGAETEIAASVEVVGATMAGDGSVAYQPLMDFRIPSGKFEFDPDGVALRLKDLTADLEQGDHFPLDLLFSDDELEISVEVEAVNATAHSHAGHSH